jgi:hypothetical protein
MAADEKAGKGRTRPGLRRVAGGGKKAASKKPAAKKPVAKKAPKKAALARKSAAKKFATKKSAAKKAVAKKPAIKSPAIKNAATKTHVAPPIFKAAAKPSTKRSQLPPLPPPLAPPKKASRSPARRAIGLSTVGHRTTPGLGEPLSESELREKMRLASTYIETWLNRRIVFAAEVTAPEDAWAQVWLWLKQTTMLDDGRMLTQDLFEALYVDEMTQDR